MDGPDDLRIRQRGCGAHRVDVALGELAEAAPGGAVGPPDRAESVPLVGRGQLAAVSADDPGQGHGVVVAQGQVGFAGGFVGSPFEDLEDECRGFVAELAGEDLQALERGGLQGVEAVTLEHRADGVERRPAAAHFLSQEIPGT